MNLGVPTRKVRIAVQFSMFSLWAALVFLTKYPIDSWLTDILPVSLFLRIDPLVMTVVCGGMRMAVTITLLGLVTLGISLLLGRVFCGWVCPFGTLFDFVGWFLRRARVKFEGPSPSWFRLKYYLLAAIILFSLFGGVSPLMGLDPIVIITRVAATVIEPFGKSAHLWSVDDPMKYFGAFVDFSTLLLFMVIMAGTTRLSRIWCRTACPLGAYLGLTSRYSILRRDATGCVHCKICANHCPTGAINFQNEEIYNESECIKCFLCSSECPVDANKFVFTKPTPIAPSHHPVSLERRALLATTVATAVAAPLMRLEAGETNSSKRLLRPPMSRDERDFLASCIRCTECIKACPTGVLKTSGTENGLRAFWSPVLIPTEGYCKEGCNACSEACPTDAIMKYPIEKKYSYKIGTAMLESNRCISYTERKFCSECIKACPTNAIDYEVGWEPEGGFQANGADFPAPDGKTPTRPIYVDFEKCVGCGACEFECNKIVFGEPAMITTSYGRGAPTSL